MLTEVREGLPCWSARVMWRPTSVIARVSILLIVCSPLLAIHT